MNLKKWLILIIYAIIIIFSNREQSTKIYLEYNSLDDGIGQIFYDKGKGYSEKDSIKFNVKQGENQVTLNLPPKITGNLRLDPIDKITKIEYKKSKLISEKEVKILKIAHLINSEQKNKNKKIEIKTLNEDPIIIFENVDIYENLKFNYKLIIFELILFGIIYIYFAKNDKIFNANKILLIFLIVLMIINKVLIRIEFSNYFRINGDFQNYNPWRRILEGQSPIKDFSVYLGFGHLYLGSFFTKLFGNNFESSLIASTVLINSFGALFIGLLSYCILKNIFDSCIIVFLIFLIKDYNIKYFKWIYLGFNQGLDMISYPGVSARGIRMGIIFISGFFILKFIKEEKIGEFRNIFLCSFLSSFGIYWSNDFGISSFLVLSLLIFLSINKLYFKNYKKILKILLIYLFSFVLNFILIGILLTQNNLIGFLKQNYEISSFQSWYYLSPKLYYLKDIFYFTNEQFIIYIILFGLVIFLIIQVYIKNKMNIQNMVLIYVLLSLILASMMYRFFSGGLLIEPLSLSLLVISIGYIYLVLKKYLIKLLLMFNIKNKNKLYYLLNLLIFILIIKVMSEIIDNYKKYENTKSFKVEKLEGNITVYMKDLNEILKLINGQKVFSTYSGALEILNNQYQPSGIDYIIHVLGYESRKEYLNKLKKENFNYIVTVSELLTPWEEWVKRANWFFYKELYKNYDLIHNGIYGKVWRRKIEKKIIQSINVIKVNKNIENEYEILVMSNQQSGIIDIDIDYELKLKFSKNIPLKKQLGIIENGDLKYFIDPKNTKYNIPIFLENGIGKIVLKSYPENDTELLIKKVEILDYIQGE